MFLLTLAVIKSLGQDAPPPAYLVQQDFPDSVTDLTLLKLNGNNTSFLDVLELYKGKKVVVDFWASWCKDCIGGVPKIKKLRDKTSDDKVVYLFISLDKDEAKWKAAINRFDIKGEHYRIEIGWQNTLSNYVELDWIPRYVVLNEQGRIIMPKAVSADDKALLKSLIE